MKDKRSIQHTIDNIKLPENYVRCFKDSENKHYLVLPDKIKYSEVYKMQIIGTTLAFRPIKNGRY